MDTYHPTLWRTCRILANSGRLLCLRAVLEQPGRTVGDIAEKARISETVASEHLRALQARGLIQASRQSRWVHYAPKPDPLVKSARPLLAALRRALLTEGKSEAEIIPQSIRTLTAFTHPRRLAILRQLQIVEWATAEHLSASTQISLPALSRHLSKLSSRQLVDCEDHSWRLSRCSGRLEKVLLSLLAAGET